MAKNLILQPCSDIMEKIFISCNRETHRLMASRFSLLRESLLRGFRQKSSTVDVGLVVSKRTASALIRLNLASRTTHFTGLVNCAITLRFAIFLFFAYTPPWVTVLQDGARYKGQPIVTKSEPSSRMRWGHEIWWLNCISHKEHYAIACSTFFELRAKPIGFYLIQV